MRPRLRRSVQRWALANEIGHLLANHPQPCLYDPAAVPTAEELEANAFAAQLLLPRRWLLSCARATRLQSPVQQIRTLSRIFIVPEPRVATEIRNLHAEGLLP